MDAAKIDQRINEWKPESLRLTVFSREPIGAQLARGWMEAITGTSPQEILEKPGALEFSEGGALGDGSFFQIQSNTFRVDVVVSGLAPVVNSFPAALLGEAEEQLDAFVAKVGPWLTQLDLPILRIALAVRAFRPVSDVESGYQLLQDYLPFVKLDCAQMKDFALQFNIRAPLTGEVPFINRFTKWSTVGLHLFSAMPSPTDNGPVAFAGLVELDVNTPNENKNVIEAKSRARLLQEILSNTKNILQGGKWCQ